MQIQRLLCLLNSNRLKVYDLKSTSTTYKEDFKKWFANAYSGEAYVVHIFAGFEIITVGYKTSNEKYGSFIKIRYGDNLGKFCDIINGEFTFY